MSVQLAVAQARALQEVLAARAQKTLRPVNAGESFVLRGAGRFACELAHGSPHKNDDCDQRDERHGTGAGHQLVGEVHRLFKVSAAVGAKRIVEGAACAASPVAVVAIVVHDSYSRGIKTFGTEG